MRGNGTIIFLREIFIYRMIMVVKLERNVTHLVEFSHLNTIDFNY